jgi:hypothetical protein
MGRQTWLADELRKAGIKVVEVSGWKTRGSDSFNPVGVTWHATAGSRNSTAQGEVNVILNGSTSAPPPIAQIMLDRDGTAYICAAGRCNHNKTGWAGPNKGLGNTSLIGIEMANDNRGEPWPATQLEAARRLTAVIFRKLGTDPRKRLAAHFEHQPYAGRPAGEGSTKSDPLGVNMTAARAAVYAYKTNGWDDDVSLTEDMIPVSKTTGRELFTPVLPEGEEVPASELLQLTAIWSKRAAEGIRVASDMIKIVADRDEVDETLLGQQITAALAPAVADRVAETLATLLEEQGSLSPDQIREASAAGVREVLRQGVDDDTP